MSNSITNNGSKQSDQSYQDFYDAIMQLADKWGAHLHVDSEFPSCKCHGKERD